MFQDNKNMFLQLPHRKYRDFGQELPYCVLLLNNRHYFNVRGVLHDGSMKSVQGLTALPLCVLFCTVSGWKGLFMHSSPAVSLIKSSKTRECLLSFVVTLASRQSQPSPRYQAERAKLSLVWSRRKERLIRQSAAAI